MRLHQEGQSHESTTSTNTHLLKQEVMFNLGRAYQQLGLVHLAVPFYQTVIATAAAAQSESRTEQPSAVGYFNEASYNLSLIYRASGSPDLARAVLRRVGV